MLALTKYPQVDRHARMRVSTPFDGTSVRVLLGRPLKVQRWSAQRGGAVASQQPARALGDAVAIALALPVVTLGAAEALRCCVRVVGRRSCRGGRCAIEVQLSCGGALREEAPRPGFWSDRKRRAAGSYGGDGGGDSGTGEILAVVDTYAAATEANAVFDGPVAVLRPSQFTALAGAGGSARAAAGSTPIAAAAAAPATAIYSARAAAGSTPIAAAAAAPATAILPPPLPPALSTDAAADTGGGDAGPIAVASPANAPAWPLICTVILSQAGRHRDAESYDLHFSEVAVEVERVPALSFAVTRVGADRAGEKMCALEGMGRDEELERACAEAQRVQCAFAEVSAAAAAAAAPAGQLMQRVCRRKGRRKR